MSARSGPQGRGGSTWPRGLWRALEPLPALAATMAAASQGPPLVAPMSPGGQGGSRMSPAWGYTQQAELPALQGQGREPTVGTTAETKEPSASLAAQRGG